MPPVVFGARLNLKWREQAEGKASASQTSNQPASVGRAEAGCKLALLGLSCGTAGSTWAPVDGHMMAPFSNSIILFLAFLAMLGVT